MRMNKMLYRGSIMVDVDGVLADFEGRFCQDFGSDNRHLYCLEDRYPKVDPELIREYATNPENYKDLAPIFGGLLFIRQAHQRGWYVLLVTSRDKSLREVTKSWLSKYNATYDELIFSRNKSAAIDDFEAMNPTKKMAIVVDDSVSVLQSMPERYCVAWSQLWNFGYYPMMNYSGDNMKIMIKPSKYEASVGAWDMVGKQ